MILMEGPTFLSIVVRTFDFVKGTPFEICEVKVL